MSDAALETRVLVLAPTGRDAELIRTVLDKSGIASQACSDVPALCRALAAGAGAVLLVEEVLAERGSVRLAESLQRQPAWSDLPVLILTQPGADSPAVLDAVTDLGNTTLLERPIRIAALVSSARSALRARQRQYQIRTHLADAEEAARTRAHLAAIVESSDDAIMSKTLEGIITTWNAGAERLFEYSADEVIGKSITLIIPPDRMNEEEQILRQLRLGRRVEHYETVRMARSGRRIDISVTVSPVRDEGGRVVGASNITRDISDRKRADAMLKDADRRKDEFLAMLAHELRNPLAPIRSSLQTIGLAKSDAVIEPALDIMNRQVDHMVRLVDDLLEVSRISRGKIELRPERVELEQVIATAVETSRPLIDASGHELFVANPPKGLLLDADPVRLSQVFANLLNNAAKYTPRSGTIWLTTRVDGQDVVISVRDTGVGIAPAMMSHVFEMFSQAGRPEGPAQDGLGIGLWLVRNLVEMHRGSVEVNSAGAGEGSEFVVRLPIAARVAQVAERVTPRDAAVSDERLAWLSVLIVDDNHDAADSLAAVFRSLGARTQVAYDGPAALRLLELGRPDVALLDIGMPRMNGYEVARRIRTRPEWRDLVLIALTGWGQEEDRRRAQEAGFDHHIGKPAGVTELRALMAKVRDDRLAPEVSSPTSRARESA